MRKVLFTSFDMEIGGVERSLISLLDNFNYQDNQTDLMLFRHKGDLLNLVSKNVNMLDEIPKYTSFRKSIMEVFSERYYSLGFMRIIAKLIATSKSRKMTDSGYLQMQLMWKYSLRFLPKLNKEYDVAISYLWPHYFVAEKVKAKKKIAWIHTDYSVIETDIDSDIKMWKKFDCIVAVSEDCKKAFLSKYKEFAEKIIVIENINEPNFVRNLAGETVNNPMLLDNRFKIVTVARLSHAKGIDMAVEALKRVKEQGNNDICWYVVGYGGDEKKIKNLIKLYNLEDSFILLGKKSNPYPYIKAANLYVQPSRYEGKAVTVTEAKILGKPILITKYPTASSQILNGVEGIICDLSIEGLSDGIEKLYSETDIRNEFIENVSNRNYGNTIELEKLYKIVSA
ncbi:glycosyltransferase [Bacillus sp. UMB0893]|uniref:glycosyltransferase n=1 Tax=Bacillus sp. UMB0893 TaxID=2066053 RepID=UPI000C757644|nr:glycosyltransferase [Bacillus sp. UMB0893]PLR68736.1 glycosyl transferase [Bacillus sp. UMB0893]